MHRAHVYGGVGYAISGIRAALVRRHSAVAAGVSLLLSFMPAMSNSVAFAQEQHRVTVSNQAQPVMNDLLRVVAWPQGSLQTTIPGSILTLFYQDDGYHWTFNDAARSEWDGEVIYTASLDPLVRDLTSNVILQVDAGKTTGGDHNPFGLVCRLGQERDGWHGYAFRVSTDGTASIERMKPDGNGGFEKNQLAIAAVPAAQGYRLRAVCNDSHLSLSVNGTMTVEADDDAPFGAGRLALYAEMNESDSAEFVFANLKAQHP